MTSSAGQFDSIYDWFRHAPNTTPLVFLPPVFDRILQDKQDSARSMRSNMLIMSQKPHPVDAIYIMLKNHADTPSIENLKTMIRTIKPFRATAPELYFIEDPSPKRSCAGHLEQCDNLHPMKNLPNGNIIC